MHKIVTHYILWSVMALDSVTDSDRKSKQQYEINAILKEKEAQITWKRWF